MRSPSSRRRGRTLFLVYMLAAYGAIFMAVPLVSALEPQRGWAAAQAGKAPSASAGSSTPAPAAAPARAPSFDDADRNKDGQVDKSEAAVVPGLSANFERVDTNKDGRLDRAEFDKAVPQLEARK